MKFGKYIQAEQVPGWSQFYLDYKFLKKIVSSLAANRPGSEAAVLALGIRPADILNTTSSPTYGDHTPTELWGRSATGITMMPDSDVPPILSAVGQDEDKGPDFQAHKAVFFFKLERELEKINAFYLQKEAELKLRLETLLSKRRAAAMRVLPDSREDDTRDHVEWNAVEEGLRLLERDLGKLQHFVEVNATGFRKILKKWDKRSKSQTKELYLARQVDVQPVFNRQLISELSDTVASCLLHLTDLTRGVEYEGPAANDLILSGQLNIERSAEMRPFYDLESSLRNAVHNSDMVALRNIIRYSDTLVNQPGGKTNVSRILWKAAIDSPPELADLILSTPASSFDFLFVDDINGRTCLHQAAIAGVLRLVEICLDKGVPPAKTDAYGRSALHYAAMNGHADVCRLLLEVKVPADVVDMDNFTPLIHATLKGSVDCIRILLNEGGIAVQPRSMADLFPLSLASRTGHLDVVVLLLEHGAESIPNSNGEYPIHLAAREGHVKICELLVQHDGWDVPDKYNEWTPLFHAARWGHDTCIQVLLEAGCKVNAVDEFGNEPVHYAAWYGHHAAVTLLLEAAGSILTAYQTPRSDFSPDPAETQPEDVDMIPTLSLPPPIMPYRVYGHNYLDKNCLVQISIGRTSPVWTSQSQNNSAVRLYPPFMDAEYQQSYLHSSPLFKLVMTASPDATSAPYSVPLPLQKNGVLFSFQVPSFDELCLEFSLYPNFGTKTIGRAVALPALLRNLQDGSAQVLPVLDHRLHVIGEVSIGVNIITPFRGATLGVGGAVETYWKSTAVPALNIPRTWAPASISSRSPGSTHTSPSNQSNSPGTRSVTVSSISGEYIYAVIQVTRDLYPVVYPHWKLPVDDFDLGVADVSLTQFEHLAARLGRKPDLDSYRPSTTGGWHDLIRRSMISLDNLLTIIPSTIGLCLELAYAPPVVRQRYSIRTQLRFNDIVDSLLRTIYQRSQDFSSERRRIIFTSFSPDLCAALNWKQPNYPVFFVSQCGRETAFSQSPTVLSIRDADDQRLLSLASAVEFAKSSNLLGVLLEADLLVKVPSLIEGVKDSGLLVMIWGSQEMVTSLASTPDLYEGSLDALLRDGVLTCLDHQKSKFGVGV